MKDVAARPSRPSRRARGSGSGRLAVRTRPNIIYLGEFVLY